MTEKTWLFEEWGRILERDDVANEGYPEGDAPVGHKAEEVSELSDREGHSGRGPEIETATARET